MVLFKYKLPNDNVFIWLGKGGTWGKSEGIDNVLVLAGGDVLFLKTVKAIPLWKEEVKEDVKNLSQEEFTKKYKLPTNGELWKELKRDVEVGKYPPYLENPEERIKEYKNMISAYINGITRFVDPDKNIQQLESIIEDCQRKIFEIKARQRKS